MPNSEHDEHSDRLSSDDGDASEHTDEPEMDSTQREESKYKYIVYAIWFCFWATCWMIAIELKFGIVYLLFSGLFFIYFSTHEPVPGVKTKLVHTVYSTKIVKASKAH